MSRKSRPEQQRGFSLIEVLVALALVAFVLGAIGTLMATSVRGTRALEDRVAASSVAETLLAGLSNRASVRVGRASGETAGYRWIVDVAPMPVRDLNDTGDWRPLGVTIQVQGKTGRVTSVSTVVLIARAPA